LQPEPRVFYMISPTSINFHLRYLVKQLILGCTLFYWSSDNENRLTYLNLISINNNYQISNKVEVGSQIPDQTKWRNHMVHVLKAVGGSSPLGR